MGSEVCDERALDKLRFETEVRACEESEDGVVSRGDDWGVLLNCRIGDAVTLAS